MSISQIRIVKTRAEFDAVMDCQWSGFISPVEPFWDLWFPTDIESHIAGHSAPRSDAVAESKERMWTEHVGDPSSTWIYVSNPQTGEVLASCQWRVYPAPTNPFATGLPNIQCAGWPAGSAGAAFVAKLARGLFTSRVAWMGRPHVGKQAPSYRLFEWCFLEIAEIDGGNRTFLDDSKAKCPPTWPRQHLDAMGYR